MPKARGDEPLSRQNLKAALWYTVAKIAEQEEPNLEVTVSEHFVATLTEFVFQQALSLGKDLEQFAHKLISQQTSRHGGRTTVATEDVKLACRRNPALYEHISTQAVNQGLSLSELNKTSVGARVKPRPRVSVGAKAATAAKKQINKPQATTAKKCTVTTKKTDMTMKGSKKVVKVPITSSDIDDEEEGDEVIDLGKLSQGKDYDSDEMNQDQDEDDDDDGGLASDSDESVSSMDQDIPSKKKPIGKLRRGGKKS
ncbi:hypothetical protein OIO90_000771 [Microbotryomycetes sp. JL221]|nr:hypothetical protein OIO90_000771 [Microbotryomycetes sp. JL221]